MAAHAPWSREEVSLLLRAWADAVESRPSREVGHAAFLRYEALYCASACGGYGSVSSRAEASVFNKRKSLENMHTVISLFLTSISVISGQSKEEEEEEEECNYLRSSDKLRVWFGMPETKRRRWFAAHNKKSYLYTEIAEEQFAMITAILMKSNDSILPPLSVHMRPKVKVAKSESEPESIAEPALSDQDMAAAIMHARESFRIVMERFTSRNGLDTIYMKDEGVFIAAAAQVVEEEPAVIAPPPPQFQIGNPVVEGDESDTESEGNWEEIVPSSPIREADVGSDAISTGTGSQKRKLSRSTSDTHPRDSTYPDKRAKIVHPELLDVLNTLEKQTRTLKEAYRSTKLARRRDQVERQEILRSLRQEQNERQYILESLRRQEEEVRQQRAAWRREQEEIRREYTELLDSN